MYIIRLLQYIHIGIFKTIFKYQLLFTISDMIILNLKQFPGLSVSYLKFKIPPRYLIIMEISAVFYRPWLFLIFYFCHTVSHCFVHLLLSYLSSHFKMGLY